jgi:hypothetical protein
MEDEFLLPDHNGMAGVVAPLVACHDVGMLAKDINDLALTLVAPLGSDDSENGHEIPPQVTGQTKLD